MERREDFGNQALNVRSTLDRISVALWVNAVSNTLVAIGLFVWHGAC